VDPPGSSRDAPRTDAMAETAEHRPDPAPADESEAGGAIASRRTRDVNRVRAGFRPSWTKVA